MDTENTKQNNPYCRKGNGLATVPTPLGIETKSNLKTHIESIHEGKTFKCDICTSNFKANHSLKMHIESVHQEPLTVRFVHQVLHKNVT